MITEWGTGSYLHTYSKTTIKKKTKIQYNSVYNLILIEKYFKVLFNNYGGGIAYFNTLLLNYHFLNE